MDPSHQKSGYWQWILLPIFMYTEDKQTELLYCFPCIDIGIEEDRTGPCLTLTLPREGVIRAFIVGQMMF